ncbi:MAG: hypothetical protein HYV09_03495 [Deltaproteobacteria bacterium]|nr:hypothetical protein [Deltaproteobacteria bacterium]
MGELIPKALIDSARPEYWISFLETYATYCAERDLPLDARVARSDRDRWYRTLQKVVRGHDPARPDGLRAASKRLAHVADDGGRERLVACLRRRNLGGELVIERRTDLELALAVFHKHPTVFEEAALFKQAALKDNFWEYLPHRPTRILNSPSAETEETLRAAMSEHHYGYGHTAYCRLDVEPTPHEIRFVFSRGNAHRSHGIVSPSDERDQIDYTPELHDVALLDRATGRLSLSCGKLPHVEFARRLFGCVLFNDPRYFSGDAIYSGAPLLEAGEAALSTRGIAGLRQVVLRTVSLRRDDGRIRVLGAEEGSVFPEDAAHLERYAREGCRVTSMRFDLLYGNSGHLRPLEIHTPNHIIFDRQIAEHAVREFLVARGFAYYGDDHLDLAA